jgi:hypothetical protein
MRHSGTTTRKRTIASGVIVALTLSLSAVVTAAVAGAQPVEKPVSAEDDPVAMAKRQAKTENRRVEIETLRGERSTIWANPDGTSLHAELSSTPVRIKRNGTWVPVDPTLVEHDGIITPKATKIPLALPAGGGSAIIAKPDKGLTTVSLPGPVPWPKIAGSTATYPDAVAAGIDLVIEATVTGFEQRIVLRAPPKTAPVLRFPVSLPGNLRYDTESSGRTRLLAGDTELADISWAPMSDATGDAGGAHRALAKVSVDRDAKGQVLTIRPDQAFLTGGAATYPVTVAVPSDWVGAGLDADTFVSSVQYPNSQQSANWLRAGKSSSGAETWRSYVKFFVAGTPLDGAHILNADLRMWNYRSNDCGNAVGSGIVVRRITAAWSPSTLTWSSQPPTTTSGQSANQAAYSDTCSWGVGELFYSIEAIVQEWASGTAPDYGVQLRAVNESDATNWRQYRSSEYTGTSGRGPVLFVDYEPAQSEDIFSVTGEVPPGTITHDQAVATRVGTPEQESAAPPVTPEQAQAMRINADQGFAPGEETGRPDLDEDWSEELPDCGGAQALDCFPELEPDTTPPALTATTPADGATGVAASTPVSATFDEPVTGARLVLRNPAGTAVAGGTTTSADRTTVTFTPAQPLAGATRYTAELTGAADDAGNQIAPIGWSFTTTSAPPGVLTLPVQLDGWIDDTGGGSFTGDTVWAGAYGFAGFDIHERSYLKFDTTALAGKTITDAKLQLWGVEADGCGTAQSGITAQRVTGAWTASTLQWSNQPATTASGQATATDAGGCGSPASGQPWTWPVTGIVQAWSGGQANQGILLRGVDESAAAPLYDRGWRAAEPGGAQVPVLVVTYTSAPAAMMAPSGVQALPNRRFYQHVTFAECDDPANKIRVWNLTGGWTKNSFGWCKKVTHLLTKWQLYWSWILANWSFRKVAESSWVYTSLVNTYVGGRVAKGFTGAAQPDVRTIVARSRIDTVHAFGIQSLDDTISIRAGWTASGCTDLSAAAPARTISQWSREPNPVTDFTFYSDESGTGTPDRVASCDLKPYDEIVNGWVLPNRKSRGVEEGYEPAVRCDTSPLLTMYYGGCVLARTMPRMVVSTAAKVRQSPGGRLSTNKAAEFAQHVNTVFTAPDTTIPLKAGGGKRFPGNGAPGNVSPPMTRATDPAIEQANRSVTESICTSEFPQERVGKDCDEYPFAKTHQGAASTAWDVSIRPISPSSNRSGGARQNLLWMRYRILEGDPFKVWVVTSSVVPDSFMSGSNSN